MSDVLPTAVWIKALLFAATVACALVPLAPAARTPAPPHAQRAAATYAAMLKTFAGDKSLLLDHRSESTSRYAHVWPLSQALDAGLAMAGLPLAKERYASDVRALLQGLELYWNGASPARYDSAVRPPHGIGGEEYYDDNVWVGLALVDASRRLGDRGALGRAQQAFAFVVSGWREGERDPCRGGVLWKPGSTERNTVSTAGGALLGLELLRETRNPEYLREARRMYGWVRGCLRDRQGLYWDNIKATGAIDRTRWSYNQGAMIGAGVLLYRWTGDRAYLRQAETTARTALRLYGARRYAGERSSYVAIFFHNLWLLHRVRPDAAYVRAIEGYAERRWRSARQRGSGLFRRSPARAPTLIDQASMVKIYADLAAKP